MQTGNQVGFVRIAAGEVRVMDDVFGVEFRCLEGRIWLTQYGDDRDVVLEGGRGFVPASAAVVVVSSSRGALLSLSRPLGRVTTDPRPWWRRALSAFGPRGGGAMARSLQGRQPASSAAFGPPYEA